jgi:large subunit ribosomal protein L23
MHATQIIKRPLITEKCTWEAEKRNRYSFEVALAARKEDIRKAIQDLYHVRVEKIATQVRKGKYLKTRFGVGKTSTWKRATVQLHPDDRIDLF